MAAETGQIDSTIDIVTPENIAFNYRVAGPFRRLPAYLIDLIVILLLTIVIYFVGIFLLMLVVMLAAAMFAFSGTPPDVVSSMGMSVMAIIGALAFFLRWLYGGLFETYMNGRTPGKWIMGVRVLTTDGQPISGLQAILRNILRDGDAMPLLPLQIFGFWLANSPLTDGESGLPPAIGLIPTFGLALLAMTLTRRYQRIGDLVCGTMVVLEERSWLTGVARVEDPRTAQLADLLPPKFEISRSLSRTLATYVDRRRYISAPRRREIARHLGEPLLREFGLPADTSHDLLLCALYYRAFIADRGDQDVVMPPPMGHPQMTFPQTGIQFLPAPLPQEQMVGMSPQPFHIRR